MNKRKILLTLVSVGLIIPAIVRANEVWNGAFEASPGNSDAVSAGAGKIRDTRTEVRQRLDVEHIIGGTSDITDDNGLHRMGSGRCFMQATAPTALADSITDYDNTGGVGVADLDDSSTNSGGTAVDDVGAGRCWIDTDDNNKLYVYIGVAGDDTGSWVEVYSSRVKAGAANVLYHGDWDMGSVLGDGCNTPTTNTTAPLGWSVGSGAPTFAYAAGTTSQGVGCVMTMTATGVDNYITQTLTNLKGSTTYRVVAQVKEGGADECQVVTANAATNIAEGDMVSVDDTAFVTLEGTFVTAAALDTVDIRLMNSASGDICSWDHVAVYRQENAEIGDNQIQMVRKTLTEADLLETSCVGAGDPVACCTGAGTGPTCEITGAYQDVSDMSIKWTPPTEGWMVSLRGNVSFGCVACDNLDIEDGLVCRLEKGGAEITATERAWDSGVNWLFTHDVARQLVLETVETNPVAGTEITYTMACRWLSGDGDLTYNPTVDSLVPDTSMTMIAYPPH